ncbi:hypothetical protein [Plebeiibacterium sediminum]|uniref:Uncharacterized protein n=1 Tax=Plebeiibacterium sediminum TaxID=2992112 RepID=A0AAE3M979_9BACT|nr:hypothetical protein [Plebeiobacterium sediminum]MCW3789469.1 hypothetical protein [Plebeiobacterium sediminum]
MANTTGKKFGGRKKGTPNADNRQIKEFLTDLINDNRETIISDLEALEPKDRITILEKFMSYCVAKQKAVEQTINFDSLSENELNTIIDELSKNIES